MPITLPIQTQRISQPEFAELAYEVMNHVFAIHNDFGRLFNELIYKRELATRMDGVGLEVPITVSHDTFTKTYSLDVLVGSSGLFEFKSAEAIHPRHRAQTVNYLLLADLAHAKIVNVQPDQVEHEFVNCHQRREQLCHPKFQFAHWDPAVDGAEDFSNVLRSLIGDWGSGLELPLYESALSHFLHGQESIPVIGSAGEIGVQSMRMAAPDVAFQLTALSIDGIESFAIHARRLLRHTGLKAILWANLRHDEIRLETLK